MRGLNHFQPAVVLSDKGGTLKGIIFLLFLINTFYIFDTLFSRRLSTSKAKYRKFKISN